MEPRGDPLQPVRWRFANAVFDEANWTLAVDGQRVALEMKPLMLLRELLRRQGTLVTKDELLDAVWPGVSVVEASLTTAMLKLRRALGDDDRGERIIETVPRLGYRLVVAATSESALSSDPGQHVSTRADAADQPTINPLLARSTWTLRFAVGAGIVALAAASGALTVKLRAPPPAFSMTDTSEAMRALDLKRMKAFLATGWDPNIPYDKEGNPAVNVLLEACEWNPGHDREKLLLAARMLFDAGARLDTRNVFGDTAYSIASAKRYCGPDHPVTRMIYALCYSGPVNTLRDKCLASYQIARGERPPVSTLPGK